METILCSLLRHLSRDDGRTIEGDPLVKDLEDRGLDPFGDLVGKEVIDDKDVCSSDLPLPSSEGSLRSHDLDQIHPEGSVEERSNLIAFSNQLLEQEAHRSSLASSGLPVDPKTLAPPRMP